MALYASVLSADGMFVDLIDMAGLFGASKIRLTIDRGSVRVSAGESPDGFIPIRDYGVGVSELGVPLLRYLKVERLTGNSSTILIEVLAYSPDEGAVVCKFNPLDGENVNLLDPRDGQPLTPADLGWVIPGGPGSTTNLSVTTAATFVTVVSSDGNDGTIPAATTAAAGVMTAADKALLGTLDVDVASLETAMSGKQETLVSGTNIKTVNGQSVLGSGDIAVAGGAGASFLSRKVTVAANGQTVDVILMGLGASADLDAATVTASVDGTSSMVLTVDNTGGFKLRSAAVHVPAGANAGTSFSLVVPDPAGATVLADSGLASLVYYNATGVVQAATAVTLSMSGSNLSVMKTGLVGNTEYRFKVLY